MDKDNPALILLALQDRVEILTGAQIAMQVGLNLVLTGIRGHPDLRKVLEAELEESHARMLAGVNSDAKIQGFETMAKTMKAAIKGE
jgi:hypothetical protein